MSYMRDNTPYKRHNASRMYDMIMSGNETLQRNYETLSRYYEILSCKYEIATRKS